jgi:hypothetical protein
MSTQCGVAIKTEKGYKTIYVHSDGYPEYMWPMLTENYNSEELATKLIDHGDASYIDKKLEPTSDFHKFGTPEPDVSMFYHRDRGDLYFEVAPQTLTREDLHSCYYYVYLWEDGEWRAYKGKNRIH